VAATVEMALKGKSTARASSCRRTPSKTRFERACRRFHDLQPSTKPHDAFTSAPTNFLMSTMTNYLRFTSTFGSVGPRSSLSSTNPETSRRAPEAPMETKDLPASNDTQRYTWLQHSIATESESIQPSAKRQKTSTIESDINLNVSSKATYHTAWTTTPHY
jgi:hypothetical protein